MRSPLLLAACVVSVFMASGALASQGLDPRIDAVVQAENSFIALETDQGAVKGFASLVADDGFNLGNGPIEAASLRGLSPEDGSPVMPRWPVLAGASADGSLGFTLGPIDFDREAGGVYLTIWRRDAAGWRYVLYGENWGLDQPLKDLSRTVRPTSIGITGGGRDDLLAADAALGRAAAGDDLAGAYKAVLSCDGVLQESGGDPVFGCGDLAGALAHRRAGGTYSQKRSGIAAAGDLGWVYGDIDWDEGHVQYVRIWRREATGWRLVVEMIVGDTEMTD